MTTYAAFLRAINVGGRNCRMEDLRRLFEQIGLRSVETVIASGNVIFESDGAAPELEAEIERALQAGLGWEVATFLRDASEMRSIAAAMPFNAGQLDPSDTLYVAFLRQHPTEVAAAALSGLESKVDSLTLVGREIYWLRRRRLGESEVTGAVLEKAIRAPATVRNITTVKKVAARTEATR